LNSHKKRQSSPGSFPKGGVLGGKGSPNRKRRGKGRKKSLRKGGQGRGGLVQRERDLEEK